MARTELRHKGWRDVVIGASDQSQRDAYLVERLLKCRRGGPDLRPRIGIHSR